MDQASPFRCWHSASIASSSSGVWVRPFFPTLLDFPGRGVLSSSSRTTRSGVASSLRFLAFGSSALSERGSSSDSAGGCFPRTFPRCFEPEVEALLESCEIRLAGACFRRLAIESSWSPKESMGPVDFFRRFSSSWRASASSFHLASSPQNNPAACFAECFFPELGVVFTIPERDWLGFVRVLDKLDMFWQASTAVTRSTKDTGQLAEQLEGPGGIALPTILYRNPIDWEQSGLGGGTGS